jgi:hypothetical protein
VRTALGGLVADDEFEVPFFEGKFGELVFAHHPNQFLYLVEIHTGDCLAGAKKDRGSKEKIFLVKNFFFLPRKVEIVGSLQFTVSRLQH